MRKAAVTKSTDRDWIDNVAVPAIDGLARIRGEFIIDDVRKAIANRGDLYIPGSGTLGAAVKIAVNRRLIYASNERRRSQVKSSHGRHVTVWRSLVFGKAEKK